jgi:predicted NAD/FAD-dependent oxidoreductase
VELQGTKAGLQMQEAMSGVKSAPQLALLLTYPAPVPGAAPLLPFDGAAVVNSPYIQWISVDSAKPVSTGCAACMAC